MPKPSKKEYLWPFAQLAASVTNIIGQGISVLRGDANESPAFKTGLATSALYAAGAAYRIKQVYDERCVEDEQKQEQEPVPQVIIEILGEPLSMNTDSTYEPSSMSNVESPPPPSPKSFVERENERRFRRTQVIDFTQHQQ